MKKNIIKVTAELHSISDDMDIMELIKNKDKKAFEKLMDMYMNDIFRFSYSICKNKAIAEDITQEVFIKLWKNAGSWQPNGKVKNWLLKIAHNASIDEIRKDKNHIDISELSYILPDYRALPDEIMQQKFLQDSMKDAITSLPERQRTAIMLSYYSNRSNKEGAEIMNVSVDAFESLLARGKKSLKIFLNTIKDKL